MTEWNGGVDYWSATPTKFHTRTLLHGLILREITAKVVWGAIPIPGTQTRSKVKNISSKMTSHTDSKATCLVPASSPGPLSQLFNVTHSACLACEMYLHTKEYIVSMPDN